MWVIIIWVYNSLHIKLFAYLFYRICLVYTCIWDFSESKASWCISKVSTVICLWIYEFFLIDCVLFIDYFLYLVFEVFFCIRSELIYSIVSFIWFVFEFWIELFCSWWIMWVSIRDLCYLIMSPWNQRSEYVFVTKK